MSFLSCAEMLAYAHEQGCTLAQAVLRSDLAESRLTEEASRAEMRRLWQVMQATSRDYEPGRRNRSGRVGGDARPAPQKAATPPVRIPCDYVIGAIGQAIHSKPFEEGGIGTRWGAIQAESSSFVPGSGNVFAGGDAVSGPATVIRAVAAGKVAADNIDSFLGYHHTITVDVEVPAPQLTNTPACGRVNLRGRPLEALAGEFGLVPDGMTEEECQQECTRCLRCDHFGYGVFKGGRNIKW